MSAYRDAAARVPEEQPRGYTVWERLCFLRRECPEETIVGVFMAITVALAAVNR